MRNTRNNPLLSALKSSVLSAALTIMLMATLLTGSALAAAGEVGTPAGDYSLEMLEGGTYTLSEQSGQVVMMFVIGFG
jgi:hypothetical protein